MKFSPENRQVSFFCDLNTFKPSADTITPLMSAFRDRNLLPTTYQEMRLMLGKVIGPGAGTEPPFVPKSRLRLASPDNGWVVDFDSHRITIDWNTAAQEEAQTGTDVHGFVNDAIEMMTKIESLFPLTGNRMALVTRGVLRDLPEEVLQAFHGRLFKSVEYYEQHKPVEWTHRNVARRNVLVNSADEQLNVITGIKRIQGIFQASGKATPFDGVEIHFDINTFQENTKPRFHCDQLKEFLEIAADLRRDILKQLESLLDG